MRAVAQTGLRLGCVKEETKRTILDSALHLLNLPVLGPRPNTEKVVSTYLAPVEPEEAIRVDIGHVLAFRAREKMPGAAVGIAEMDVGASDEAICLDANEQSVSTFERPDHECYRLVLELVIREDERR
jgi:hypothetical protein